uniref:Protein kinase domain-containing protein n=1 Tax=Macrostomum lignano TaxID=282301 RepID=A0A1I8FAL5_9PLAT
ECSGRVSYLSRAQLRARLEAAKTASLSEKARTKTGEAESSSREEETPAAEVVTSESPRQTGAAFQEIYHHLCSRLQSQSNLPVNFSTGAFERQSKLISTHFLGFINFNSLQKQCLKRNPPQASRLPQEAAADEAKQKLQAEPGAEATARLNNNNSGMLSDAGIFAYCSLTATRSGPAVPRGLAQGIPREVPGRRAPQAAGFRFANSATAILRHGQADCSMLPPSSRLPRRLVLQDLLLVALREGCYDARARYLLKHVAFAMRISWASLEEWELKTAALLNDPASEAEVVDEAMRGTGEPRLLNRCQRLRRRPAEFGLTADWLPRCVPPAPASSAAVCGARCPSAPRQARPSSAPCSAWRAAGLTGGRCASACHLCIAVRGWIDQGDLDFPAALASPCAMHPSSTPLCWESLTFKEMGQAWTTLCLLKSSAIPGNAEADGAVGPASGRSTWPARYCPPSNVDRQPLVRVRATGLWRGGKVLADVLLRPEYGSQRRSPLIAFSMGAAKLIFSCPAGAGE